ncbi:winged helix-turn-helix domain-containing protein [Kitasatospora sp. NPDC059648]|uniref:winged helix-turn-helix domain-containing protein n=1 Tax=Kitasatospora sp. NPDC059648 TaxID=3346894 RepID=UPI0036B8DCEE
MTELHPCALVRVAAEDGQGGYLNSYPSGATMPVSEAVRDHPSRPVVFYLTQRRRGVDRFVYVVGEFDTKGCGAEATREHAAEYASILAEEGVAPVPARSGPSGGWHVWSGCAAGCSAETVARINAAGKALWPSWDSSPLSNPATGAVRPPGSPHRHGGHSRLTAHTVEQAVRLLGPASAGPEAYARVAERMEALAAERGRAIMLRAAAGSPAAGDGPSVPPSIKLIDPRDPARGERPVVRRVAADEDGRPYIADVPRRELTGRAARQLTRTLSDQHDHSHQFHAPLVAMAVRGWRFEQVAAVARDAAASPALEWLRTVKDATGARIKRTSDDAADRLERAWWLAVQDAARMPRRPEDSDRYDGAASEAEDAAVHLRKRMDAAGEARWARESGPADFLLLIVLSWLMVTSDSLDISADVRRLGVLAGYSHTAAADALNRLIKDGWLVVTKEAVRRRGEARRVTLATGHECTADHRHRCAVYEIPKTRQGSDRSVNAAPQKGGDAHSQNLRTSLETLLAHAQSDVWHRLGHHAARTHRVILESRRGLSLVTLAKRTGYTLRTTHRHVRRLEELGLVTTVQGAQGQAVKAVKGASLWQAARQCGTDGRIARLAVRARVEQERHRWWLDEEAWSALTREEKRAQGRRREADELVLPGMDPGRRKYPRFEDKSPDHARAYRIEAERIQAPGLLVHALQLAADGQLVDPPRLVPTEAVKAAPEPGARRRRRRPRPAGVRPRPRGGAVQVALPGLADGPAADEPSVMALALQLSCPHCDARSGQPCRRLDGQSAARPHKGRLTKARQLRERQRAARHRHGA